MSKFDKRVQQYLVNDRQWFRTQRLAHAKYMLKSGDPTDRDFWKAIIKANTLDDEYMYRQ